MTGFLGCIHCGKDMRPDQIYEDECITCTRKLGLVHEDGSRTPFSVRKRDLIRAQIMAVIKDVDCCPDHELNEMADEVLDVMGLE